MYFVRPFRVDSHTDKTFFFFFCIFCYWFLPFSNRRSGRYSFLKIYLYRPTTYGLAIYGDGEKFKLTLYFWVEGVIKYILKHWLVVLCFWDLATYEQLGHFFPNKRKLVRYDFISPMDNNNLIQWPLFTIIRDSTIFFLSWILFSWRVTSRLVGTCVSGQFSTKKDSKTNSNKNQKEKRNPKVRPYLISGVVTVSHFLLLLLFENYDCGWCRVADHAPLPHNHQFLF